MIHLELRRKLEGTAVHSTSSSHEMWLNPTNGRETPIPRHGNRDLSTRTLHRICRNLGISRSEFDQAQTIPRSHIKARMADSLTGKNKHAGQMEAARACLEMLLDQGRQRAAGFPGLKEHYPLEQLRALCKWHHTGATALPPLLFFRSSLS